MRVYDVFTPAGVPTVTYVEREDQKLEQQLRSAIKTPGQIASLSGPSKSGKSVLINKIIPQDDLIAVSGAAIRTAEMLWERVLTWMGAPSESTIGSDHTVGIEAGGNVSAKAGILFASGETELSANGSYGYAQSRLRMFARGGIDQVVKEIANSDYVVFIDDFHYMSTETQVDVARQIKEAAEKGISICTASVPHRADDVVRGNPELRGRVKAIDFAYWKPNETVAIGEKGFNALNVDIDLFSLEVFSAEAFGSPQLMQQICLQACLYLGIEKALPQRKRFDINPQDRAKIFEHAATTADFSSLLDALHSGPKQRGTIRNQFPLIDGSVGDVYRCILLAIRQNPPRLSFNYDDIYQRTRNVCTEAAPAGSSVAQALAQINEIADNIQPEARVIEWNEDVLDIVDPYFLYYLRCSSRLNSLQR